MVSAQKLNRNLGWDEAVCNERLARAQKILPQNLTPYPPYHQSPTPCGVRLVMPYRMIDECSSFGEVAPCARHRGSSLGVLYPSTASWRVRGCGLCTQDSCYRATSPERTAHAKRPVRLLLPAVWLPLLKVKYHASLLSSAHSVPDQ